MRRKRKTIASSVLAVMVGVTSVPYAVLAAAPVQPPTITRVYEKSGHAKIEWATEMPDADVITRTGFEDGEERPTTTSGAKNPDGQQSFVDDGTGNYVFQLQDTVTGRMGNNITPPAQDNTESITRYAAKSLPENIMLSLNYRIRALAGDTHKVDMQARTGWYQEGIPLTDNEGGRLVYAQLVDFMSTPENFTVAREDGSPVVLDNGRTTTIVTSKDKNYNYGILRYMWNSSTSRFELTGPSVPWNDGTIMGPAPTINKDVFHIGERVLTHRSTSYSFPSRSPVTGEGWVTLSSNVEIPNMADYDSLVKGLGLRSVWSTNGLLQLDEVKLGYATEVQLLRDGVEVYRGYLSDFEDTEAVDKESPTPTTDLRVKVEGHNKIQISYDPAEDRGTTYTYSVVGYPKNEEASQSAEKKLTLQSGLKGYAVQVSKTETMAPSSVVTTTSTDFEYTGEVPKGNFYVHVNAVDNRGNLSEVTTYAFSDNAKPTGTVTASKTEWLPKGQKLTLTALGYDAETWVSSVVLPDGREVEGNMATYDVEGNGEFSFIFKDYTGNETTVTKEITNFDEDGPVIQFEGVSADWVKAPAAVRVAVTDQASGLDVNSVEYALTQTLAAPTAPAAWKVWGQVTGELQVPEEGKWYVHVRAKDGVGNTSTSVSSEIKAQAEPTTPTLTVGVITDKTARVSVSAPGGYTEGYTYSVEDQLSGRSWVLEYPQLETELEGLEAGTLYNLQVRAVNKVGTSAYSPQVSLLTLPRKPESLEVSRVNYDPSTVKYKFVAESADSYEVEVTETDTQNVVYTENSTGQEGQVTTGLESGRTYMLAVRAKNATGYSAPATLTFKTVPAAPSGLTLVYALENEVMLGWESETPGSEYQLERDMTVLESVYSEDTEVRYLDKGVQGGTRYTYRVSERSEEGYGAYSEVDVETAPMGAGDVKQIAATSTSVTVSWSPGQGAQSYRFWNPKTGDWASPELTGLEYTFDGLVEGSVEGLQLVSRSPGGLGGYVPVTVQTLPGSQPDTAVKEVSTTGALLEIPTAVGATRYRVEVDGWSSEGGAGERVVPDLLPGTLYTYTVTPGNTAGWGHAYTGSFTTSVSAPSNLKVTVKSESEARLEWNAVQGALGYRVETEEGTPVSDSKDAYVELDRLEPGSSSKFYVLAYNAAGDTERVPVTVKTVPGQVGKVKTSDIGVHTASLTWASVAGATGYRVKDKKGAVLVDVDKNTADVTGLESAASIQDMLVVAYNESGEGKQTDIDSFITLPSGAYAVKVEKSKTSGLDFLFEHKLRFESFVIEEGKKEVYRGKGELFNYKEADLKKKHTFTVYTENREGERSKGVLVEYTPASSPPTPSAPVSSDGGVSVTVPQTPDVPKAPVEEKEPEAPQEPQSEGVPSPYPFNDIERTFSRDEIIRLADEGLVKGYPDGRFGPDLPITRMEYAALLVRALNYPEELDLDLPFQDISRTAWYVPELKTAVAKGVAEGFSLKEFGPTLYITREQATKMTVSAKGLALLDALQPSRFTDQAKIAEWAARYVETGVTVGLMEGYPSGEFRPKDNMTRAEAAMLIARLLEK